MQLKFQLIEDRYEEVTQMVTKTEQAQLPDGSWLIRTIIYTPYLITANISQVVVAADKKKKRKKKKKSKKKHKSEPAQVVLFDPIG